MFQQVIITGAKSSKGDYEGRPFDSTKIYVSTMMDPSKGTMVGRASEQYDWGTSENFQKLKDLKFPITANVEFEQVTSGKSSKTIIMDLELIPATPASTTKSN